MVEYEVSSGQFQGSKIWENLWLPLSLQPFTLSAGQKTACNIAGAKMKAILNAARGVMPKDDSPQARQKRQTQSWHDFGNLLFPVTVGINAQPVEKEGRTYWNNTVSRIITPDDTRYSELMAGGEIITDGPTTGDGKKHGNGSGKGAFASQDDPGYDQPPTEAYSDDIPF